MNTRKKIQIGSLVLVFCLMFCDGSLSGIQGIQIVKAAQKPKVSDVMDVVCAPSGIAMDKAGNLFITDTYHKKIWKVANGKSTVYAGGNTAADIYGELIGGYHDGKALKSYFRCPWAISPFLNGWAVSDADNHAIRLVADGKVQTLNCTTSEKLKLDKNGHVVFDHPTGLATDTKGNLFVSDTYKGVVRKITPDGRVTTVAKKLKNPMGLCWSKGILYIAESGANRIVEIKGGKKKLVAGSGKDGYSNGKAASAAFSSPQGVFAKNDGTVFVTDTGNSAIRMVKKGKVTTLLRRDRTKTELVPMMPVGILVKDKKVYVCDNFSRKVFKFTIQ